MHGTSKRRKVFLEKKKDRNEIGDGESAQCGWKYIESAHLYWFILFLFSAQSEFVSLFLFPSSYSLDRLREPGEEEEEAGRLYKSVRVAAAYETSVCQMDGDFIL